LIEALRAATSGAGLEPGCRSSSSWTDVDDSPSVLLLEEWDTPEALERHMRTAVFRRLLAVLELSASPPEVTYVDGGRRRGIEWVGEVARGR
jgi:quinol monooxygenase YgiN